MSYKSKRIVHEIVHPVSENYEIAYLVLMVVSDGKVVQKAIVELKHKSIYAQFETSNVDTNYTFSVN